MSRAPVVAITGATGFLGEHLVTALAQQGAVIRILARRKAQYASWQGFALDSIQGSLDDANAVEQLVTGADVVVHAAGLIKARNRAEFLRTNEEGTRAIAQMTRRRAPQARFIAISSLAARAPHLSSYAASKRAGETAVQTVYSDAPEQLVILRPSAIYGPGDRETLAIFKLAAQPIAPVFGRGRAAMIHVTDVSAAIAHLCLRTSAKVAGLYALADANPVGYTMAEILYEAAHATGNNPYLIRVPDQAVVAAGLLSAFSARVRGRAAIFTDGKARELLHPGWSVTPPEMLPPGLFEAKIGLGEGFRQTAAWYKAMGWLR